MSAVQQPRSGLALQLLLLVLLVLAGQADGVSKGKRSKKDKDKDKDKDSSNLLLQLNPKNVKDYVGVGTPGIVTVVDLDSSGAQSTVTKMRRLARAYQARLNFYLINRGELPDFEGAAAGRGEDGRGVVVGAVSALRAKQPYDFTFDPHSELSVEKLKDWIDQFLSGKLKKARPSLEELPNCHTLQIDDKERALHTNDLAVRHQTAGNVDLAMQQLEEALELDPRSPILHYNMGQAREMIGEMEGAIAEYKLSLDNDIRYMDAYHSLARAISVLGDAESAVNILQLATKMQPYDGSMYNSLGVALRANNSYTRALESFTLALSLNHTLDEALLNIGSTWMDLGNFERAAGFFARALESNEHNFAALTNIVYCNQKLYNWQDHDHFMALIEQAHEVYDQLLHPFHAAAYPVSGERFKDLAVSYASNTLALVHPKFRLSHREQNDTTNPERIRLGYISTDLRHNPTRDLLLEAMKKHNKRDFEVYFLALDRDNEFVDEYVDTFVDLSVTPYRKVAVVIKELAIDILINTMVPTDPWFRVAGLNPSFCQVSLAGGYPGTTGTKLVNYVVSDRVISPPELQNLYVEKVAYIPFAIQPVLRQATGSSSEQLTRRSLGIDKNAFVFCYSDLPQHLAMFPSGVLPQTFRLWCSILGRSANAVLLILAMDPDGAPAAQIRKEAMACGLSPDQFVFSNRDLSDNSASDGTALADLFLDNPRVNAHFHGAAYAGSGAPLLTVPSQSPFSRTGSSVAVMQGRPMDGIAASLKDFEDTASSYAAAGSPAMDDARKALLDQGGRTIGGVEQWVTDVESTYRRVHRRMLRKKIATKTGNH